MENTEKAQAQILNHSGEVVARTGSLRSLNKTPAASLAPSLPSHLSPPSIINSRVLMPTHCYSLSIALGHTGCLSHKLKGVRARWQFVYQVYIPTMNTLITGMA